MPGYQPPHIPTAVLPQPEALSAPIETMTRLLPGRSVDIPYLPRSEHNPLWHVTAPSISVFSGQAVLALLQELRRRAPLLRFLGIRTLVGSEQ